MFFFSYPDWALAHDRGGVGSIHRGLAQRCGLIMACQVGGKTVGSNFFPPTRHFRKVVRPL